METRIAAFAVTNAVAVKNVNFQIHWKGNLIIFKALPDSQTRENREKANH